MLRAFLCNQDKYRRPIGWPRSVSQQSPGRLQCSQSCAQGKLQQPLRQLLLRLD
jgi:hypothetical protein